MDRRCSQSPRRSSARCAPAPRLAWFGALGGVLAVAYFVRPTNVVPLVCFGVWACTYGRSVAQRFLTRAASVAVVALLVDQLAYGHLVQPYFSANRLAPSGTSIEVLAGNLVSPSRGLFIFVPLTFVAVAGIVLKRRAGRSTGSTPRSWRPRSGTGWWCRSSRTGGVGTRSGRARRHRTSGGLVPPTGAVACHPRGTPTRHLGRRRGRGADRDQRGDQREPALDGPTASWNWSPTDVGLTHSRLWDWGDLQFLR